MKRICVCFAICVFIGCSSTSIKLGSYYCSLPNEDMMSFTISDSLLTIKDDKILIYKYNIIRVSPLLLLEMRKEGSEESMIYSFNIDNKGYIYQINAGTVALYCNYLQ